MAQIFSCDFSEIFKNTFFREHLRWLLLYKLVWKNLVQGFLILDLTFIRSSHQNSFAKKAALKNFAIFTRNTSVGVPFSDPQFYYKETPTQVFSCEYCEIFKNTSFEKSLKSCFCYIALRLTVAAFEIGPGGKVVLNIKTKKNF